MTVVPARCRRPTLLIVGCGDVGVRVLRLLQPRWRVLALSSSPQRIEALRAAGAVPLLGDLDRPGTLQRLGALADHVLHLAPPPGHGDEDRRTQALVRVLARAGRVRRLVYGSTTGVYGDCGGALFDETRAVRPATDRARRRVDAEQRLRAWGRSAGASVTLLRIPGIYGGGRPDGDPRARLLRGQPVLVDADDVHTSRIHADDLARACAAALLRGRPQRVVHVCDDSRMKMGETYELVARLSGLPPPLRLTREQAAQRLGAMTLSFMSESRRLCNHRLKHELRLRLRFPTIAEGLRCV